ncbi:hypothetical protein IQ235_00650 [Oscillatoriales cyanobacterium LEGE 11467]|uniref:Uncharacterized protein n=1 Tax=Zarconia navalis LEGE 11467 TaxID=1828826 RepID=A0A928VU08_9CYAN|nr:hypothetical protein [Zarconia navalis]MBE9039303.1 hypothetical protein [Zarconia navalis LEGE 11467]
MLPESLDGNRSSDPIASNRQIPTSESERFKILPNTGTAIALAGTIRVLLSLAIVIVGSYPQAMLFDGRVRGRVARNRPLHGFVPRSAN